ncbi:MAG: leucine-rich repeat protein, partial [Clostridia bacterium]|nr:leucine-rich repeat protein [Clostridia bacterium]
MSIYTANDLQLKVNSNNAWTVMCRALPSKNTNIFIPEIIANRYITKIAHEAFKSDSFLEMIKIPKSVEKIGHMAFMECTHLKNVVIPNSFD